MGARWGAEASIATLASEFVGTHRIACFGEESTEGCGWAASGLLWREASIASGRRTSIAALAWKRVVKLDWMGDPMPGGANARRAVEQSSPRASERHSFRSGQPPTTKRSEDSRT